MNANFTLRGDHQQKPGEGNGRKQMRDKDKRVTDYTNANIFISNNANPFLVSPYSPINTANGITTDFQQLISTFIIDISTIINPINYSIKLSTINPKPGDNLLTINADTIINDTLTVNNNFLTINGTFTGSLSVQTLLASTINVSSINTNNISTNNGFINSGVVSSLTFSTLNAVTSDKVPLIYTSSLVIVLNGLKYMIPLSSFQ